MRFALAPEQRDFAASLRKMCDAAGTPGLARAWGGGDQRGGRTLIRQLAGAGALGLAIADRDRLYTAHRGDHIRSVDPTRRLFDVVADELVAEGDSVREALAAAFDAGALATAAQLLGAGRALLDSTVAYAKQRHQFGKP